MDNVDGVAVYYRAEGQENYINTVRQFPNSKVLAQWQAASPGEYIIYVVINKKNGLQYNSLELQVTVK